MVNSQEYLEMVLRLKKPGRDILNSLTPEDCDFIHMAGCLPGEASELYEAIDTMNDEIREELGDFEFYLTAVRSIFGMERFLPPGVDDQNDIERDKFMVRLMKHSGDLWDVVKRVTVYRKDPKKPDAKFGGRTLDDVAVAIIRQIEEDFYPLMYDLGHTLPEVLQANWQKLASADKGRYGSGSYSDAQAQERRDKK
jgi:hypothetical protein